MGNKRQAVVIIHGIGEQRPMKTLRSFVTSILNYEKIEQKKGQGKKELKENEQKEFESKKWKESERTSWTKPDRLSRSYELRKISAMEFPGKRSTTHFYEYHWASNMRDTKWKHILAWFMGLMKRKPSESKSLRLKILWFLLWATPVFYLIVTAVFLLNWFLWQINPLNSFSLFQTGVLFLPLVLFLLHNIFIGFIGDAARYLRVDVENMHQREVIRRNGVALLKELHKSNDYDRIILVGHSLGSVIAYDLITYLWIDFNKAINLNQSEIFNNVTANDWGYSFGAINAESPELNEVENWSRKAQKGEFKDSEISDFQNAQSELWKAIQYKRKSWLITDLVTLGSPLAHAKFLMADTSIDFDMRKEEREYPISPPILDGNDFTYSNNDQDSFIHHATPFCITRWVNMYYKGDFIGGKVANELGPGIKDVKVEYKGSLFFKLLSYINPLSHVHYWIEKTKIDSMDKRKEYESVGKLYESMRLNDLEQKIYGNE